ncbi:DUF192 domain-containing protein [Acidithiobacillus ferriphilus]|uniref:DUF192 domain-containing protein n=1 Tax=Acidithiobacillus ferriphilus TaxID=1689834 RepID=UPI002DB7BFDE|nr:DUF192 domain-containing protein [Acidithiobacillus ferriphilus]MEB8473941.1 DUF192 domain-containing protein [Acidithiobacillus ferriphilus]
MKPAGMICRDGQTFWSEVQMADSFLDRLQGLLGKTGFSDQQGLLLTACGSVHTVGMRFPIDVIFLDAELRILTCHPEVSAWRMKSCRGAHMTLEVAAGGVARHGVVPGQRLTWRTAQSRS